MSANQRRSAVSASANSVTYDTQAYLRDLWYSTDAHILGKSGLCIPTLRSLKPASGLTSPKNVTEEEWPK